MSKSLTRRILSVVAVATLIAPGGLAFAQSSAPKPIVTGGDPQPTGSALPSLTDLLLLLPYLASL